MKITGFLDFKSKALFTQIEYAKQFNLTYLLLRHVDDKIILDLTDEEIVKINGMLRKERLAIAAVDPLIQSYDLYSIESYQENFLKYEQAILKAKQLKTNNVILRLPIVNDIINEFETVERQLTPLIEIADKNNVNLLIDQGKTKTNVLTYIIKYYKSKRLNVIFNPKAINKNGGSITASYRLLRNDITFLVTNDVDKKNNPALLGYGRLKILDLFKRFIRDKYRGFLILDDSFKNYFINEPTEEKSFFKKLFSRKGKKENQQLMKLQNKILPNEKELILTIEDIYLNQIDVLNVIFKAR